MISKEEAREKIEINIKLSKGEIDNLINETLKLISLYKLKNLTIPFTIKGNLGEFLVYRKLLDIYSIDQINFSGGARPGYDIKIKDKKIQVKTQIKKPSEKFKNGEWDYESSPTIKKNILDKKKCDILILVILYPNGDFNKIDKSNIYIFNKKDFKYFDTKFCWSGKSKGDYTIVNILYVKGYPPTKLKEKINFYNKPEYKNLFYEAKDNWGKIKIEQKIIEESLKL